MSGVQFVVDLLDFINQHGLHESTEFMRSILPEVQMRVLAVDILRWLGMQHRFSTDRAMSVGVTSTSGEALIVLTEQSETFRNLFSVTMGTSTVTLNFDESVPSDVRKQMRTLAAEGYRPRVRT